MNIIKNIPTPISGLALGIIALGNLLKTYSTALQLICAFLSLIIILLLLLKFAPSFSNLKKEISNPLIATVLATFPMALMLDITALKSFMSTFSTSIWFLGIILDISVLTFVILNFIIKDFRIGNIYPTWFITFVGPAVITVTAISHNLEWIGIIFFWISFFNYIILIPFVFYRVYWYRRLFVAELPTITIFCAPGGLLLASYMIGITNKSNLIILLLLFLCSIFFIFVIMQLPFLLRNKFKPSFSSFTFPIVICTIAFKQTYLYYYESSTAINILQIFIYILELFSTTIVLYVAYSFVKYMKTN